MDEPNVKGATGSRRDEDIALDLMKFIAVTSGYGKTSSPEQGFKVIQIRKPKTMPTTCSTSTASV